MPKQLPVLFRDPGSMRGPSARWSLPAAVVAGLLTVGSLGGCGSAKPDSPGATKSPPETATASSTTVAPTASSPSPATSGKTTTAPALPVVVCPTVIAITPPPGSIAQPAYLAVSVPDRLAGQLAVYTDNRGTMRLIGPRHWSCRALYGADGSGGIAIYPTGQAIPPDWGAGWKLPATSTVQAVIGIETSACAGCTEGQACPLFISAAKDFMDGFGRPCPATRPAAENLDNLGAGVVAFEDPPGVAGDGVPSGGRYPANGVMTYHTGNPDGSWLETCTITPDQKDLCTASLNYFVLSYGSR